MSELAKLRAEIKQLRYEREAVADLYDKVIREPRQMDAGIEGTGTGKAGSQDSASH